VSFLYFPIIWRTITIPTYNKETTIATCGSTVNPELDAAPLKPVSPFPLA
jgi:hypothetical protein